MANLFSRILVGVDGSEAADEAVAVAARLAKEHDGRLIIAHAVNLTLPASAGEAILARAEGTAKRAGVEADRRPLDGDAAVSLLEFAHAAECSLIVISTHARRGLERMFIGSTTYAVLRGSTVPVLTVRAGENRAAKPGRCFERIVVGIDDSEPSDAALAAVMAFPAEDRRHVLICGVAGSAVVIGGGSGYHDAVMAEFREQTEHVIEAAVATASAQGVSAEGRVTEGKTEVELVAAAKEDQADLIVVGSHGRRGLRRLFLGSVAEAVVQSAPVPVLVVRSVADLHGVFTPVRQYQAVV